MYTYFAHCCCLILTSTDTGGAKKKASKKQSEFYFSCVLICKDYIVNNTFKSVQSSKPFLYAHTQKLRTQLRRCQGSSPVVQKP